MSRRRSARWQDSRVAYRAQRRAERALAEDRRAARRGLVYGPYLTVEASCSLTTAQGGACTKLRRKYLRPRPGATYPRRGTVREFSRRSRTRLMQTLCALPIRHVQRGLLFVTLTYPADYPGSWSTWKRQLDTWLKRVRRRMPRAGGTWKLEPQPRRGAPHYHLLILAPYMAKEWLSRTWYEVVGSGDLRHLRAGTQVQLAQSHRGVLSYAAKYVAKAQHLPDSWQGGVGRWWGVFGRRNLEIEWQTTKITQGEFYAALRIVRDLVDRRTRELARAPPRACPAGTWAVLTDVQAARIVATVADADVRKQPHRRRLGRRDDVCAPGRQNRAY